MAVYYECRIYKWINVVNSKRMPNIFEKMHCNQHKFSSKCEATIVENKTLGERLEK